MQKRSISKAVACLALCALLPLSACSSSQEKTAASHDTPTASQGAQANQQTSPIKVTDLANQEITLSKPLDKVVVFWSGSGGPFMTMSALFGIELDKHIVGWGNSLDEYRHDMYESYLKAIPGLKDIVNLGSPDKDDFNVEKLITLKPDAIITPIGMKEALDASFANTLQSAGIPIIYMDYHTEDFEVHKKTTLLLGEIFDKKERAQEMVDFVDKKLQTLQARLDEIDKSGKAKPRAYCEVGHKGPNMFNSTYGTGYLWGGIIDKARGDNIASASVAKSQPMAPEAIIAANPEVIILTGSYWPKETESLRMGYDANEAQVQNKIAEFCGRPGWPDLDGVKNKRVYAIHHGIARELFDFASTEFFAKAFYPEEFKDLDPFKDLQEYYQTFLPYSLDGVWMTQWK